jgi:two-component system cell cycle response regulator
MTAAEARWSASEIVPIAERLRYMRLFRLVAVLLVVVFALTAHDSVGVPFERLAYITALYIATSFATDGIWRFSRRGGTLLFGGMLIIDGLYLAWVSYATGGNASPLRYLIVLHLIAVALLASYRTGLKMALWHSLLLFVVFYAEQGKLLPALDQGHKLPGTPFQQLMAFVAVFWSVTFATTAFSAVNERELRRRRYDVEALARMAADLEATTDSVAVAEVLLDHITDTFGFQRALVLGSRAGDLSLMAYRGPERSLGSQNRPGANSVIITSQETRQTMLVNKLDPEADRWLTALLPNAKNLVVVPLYAEGAALGVLVIEHGMRSGSRMERRVISMLERFASHAALALRSAWLLEQVQQMAATDGLTGIPNRRTFETVLQRDVAKALRNGEQMSLIIMDLDHFKQLNDTHGHQAGDEALREVAHMVAGNCREFDTPARYGGEEFCLVLPSCASIEAIAIAERLRQAIEKGETVVPVTVSGGVATLPTNATDAHGLLKAADDALYESKRSGRNRVTWSKQKPGEKSSPTGGPPDDGSRPPKDLRPTPETHPEQKEQQPAVAGPSA